MGELSAADRRDYLQAVQNNIVGGKGGNFYTVDLPDKHIDKMLDWDAPLSEQPLAVREFLSDLPNPPRADQPVGEWLQPRLQEGASEYWTSDMVKRGIPGIRYFDGASRAAGQGTRNFVVFDENLIKILGKE
jgi:hypothetical protein